MLDFNSISNRVNGKNKGDVAVHTRGTLTFSENQLIKYSSDGHGEYDKYLADHISGVMMAYDWLLENTMDFLIANGVDLDKTTKVIAAHDKSKYSEEEYVPYYNYFYGDNPDSKEVLDKFNLAWLHHIKHNPHHWQSWVLINDDKKEGTIALEMAKENVIEMICDWWSFSWKTGELYEIFSWYDQRRDYIILHENTQKLVDGLLKQMRYIIDRGHWS